ncbi:unnamed protein product, partial [Prorocentrum cordatum]
PPGLAARRRARHGRRAAGAGPPGRRGGGAAVALRGRAAAALGRRPAAALVLARVAPAVREQGLEPRGGGCPAGALEVRAAGSRPGLPPGQLGRGCRAGRALLVHGAAGHLGQLGWPGHAVRGAPGAARPSTDGGGGRCLGGPRRGGAPPRRPRVVADPAGQHRQRRRGRRGGGRRRRGPLRLRGAGRRPRRGAAAGRAPDRAGRRKHREPGVPRGARAHAVGLSRRGEGGG